MNHNSAILRVESLFKSFPSIHGDGRLSILSGVDFEIAPGERLAIMGRSGGGKSTLLACLSGLDRPDSGKVLIKGQDIFSMSATALNAFRAQNIGIVFQQFQLLDHFNALENVRLPLDLAGVSPREADSRAIETLERVGLKDRLNHFPTQMSRGECQRVAIARVLAMRCPLILADEPTGSLDAKTGQAVMDLLFDVFFDVAKEIQASLVLVTHDPSLAARCDRTLLIQEGKLVAAELPK